MLKFGTRMNADSKKMDRFPILDTVGAPGGFILSHPYSSRFLLEIIGGLTMKQRKNIVKQVRNKDVPVRPVPST